MYLDLNLDHDKAMDIITGKRCLVADDNEINQNLFSHVLKQSGMNVAIAGNGQEVIEQIGREGVPDIILMDLNMPIMDGFETALYIRNKLHLHMPIIGMTAATFKEESDKAIASGMNDCITKPVAFEELRLRIAKLIAGLSEEPYVELS